ncbi:hypothetical protein ADL22_17530 [Streptomyces sp. NRRL F-4489]|uniref:polymorphic toxin-type HINT domain-containing protein n=1 Tax=Streptomyces sp. NRRL F-4489 TaxID=1609095 RepID=UPI000746A8AD|nr:polymorphic toxin-type HINT domain-containing protein [Streptomyces sp. NRRL F-4489]KUL38705.1 hypothetical protein ADL22_17530 [Streptomyces sp. NRRL F-4489]
MPASAPEPPARKSWWRRPPWLLAAGAGVLALALVAGTLLWRAAGPREESEGDRAPFYLALYNLAEEPMAHYVGSAPGGTAWDVTVTDGGEAHGQLTMEGRKFAVLRVGGKTYAKPPQELLTDLPNGVRASTLEGMWVTGDSRLTRRLADVPGSPAELASALWSGLDRITAFPHLKAAPVRPGGPMALSVLTPRGRLYVSASAPYRVLRLEPLGPAGGTTGGATAGRGASPVQAAAALRPAGAPAGAVATAAGAGGLDLTPMSPDQVGSAYDDLIGQTRTLDRAVDLGIRFNFNQSGNLSCSQSCTVTENVVTSTTAAPGARVSGTVNASMTAQVTVNGESGGGCSATATLPVNGGGTMSCVAAGTAPIVQRIKAQKQREAEAQARATRRPVRIPYTINFRAQVQIMAMASARAEIERRVKAQQADRNRAVETAKENAGPAPDCARDSFVAGTPVLTAGGGSEGAEAIEKLRPGDEIRNAAPGSGTLQRHGVGAVIVTDTDRDFVRLTVAGPHGSGTIRSTAHHLFYDAAAGSWKQAAALRPGDRLQTTGQGTATVREVRPYRAAARTYNLSVDGVHTYYVLAGDTPVLVHNCAMKRDAKSLKGIRVPRQYEGLDTAHVRRNHFPGGAGVTSQKDLWPAKMTDERLASIAQQAMRNNPRVIGYDPQTRMVQAVAVVEGKMVQFQISRDTGVVRSIYPLVPWSD